MPKTTQVTFACGHSQLIAFMGFSPEDIKIVLHCSRHILCSSCDPNHNWHPIWTNWRTTHPMKGETKCLRSS